MNYWLVKSEPDTYSWAAFCKDGRTVWDGIRNFQARNNLQQMRQGDLVLYYHSVSEKAVVGIARVEREAFPDPTSDDTRWLAVELAPYRDFKEPVTLAKIKNDERLQHIPLLRHSRLSVMPLQAEEFEVLLSLGN